MIHVEYQSTDYIRLAELRKQIDACPLCHGRDQTCSCYSAFKFEMNQINSNVRLKFRNVTLDNIKDAELAPVVSEVQKYLNNFDDYIKQGIGLYLYGNPGTAKTTLGTIILLEALRRNHRCWVTIPDNYLNMLNDRTPEGYSDLAEVNNVAFMMIEDLGREYRDRGGYIESHLEELIRSRADNRLTTIITTNKSEHELCSENNRLLSILQEHYIPVQFSTKDYRRHTLGRDLRNGHKKKTIDTKKVSKG